MNRIVLALTLLLYSCSCFAQLADSVLTSLRSKEIGQLILTSKGYQVWVQQAGDNSQQPILILPGGPGGHHNGYAPIVATLSKAGYWVSVLDMVDCGFSDRTSRPEYWNIKNFVSDIEEVRRQLGFEKIYLLGHSFGVILALEYADAYPNRLKGLILSNMSHSSQAWIERNESIRDSLATKDPYVQSLLKQASALDAKSTAYAGIMQKASNVITDLFNKSEFNYMDQCLPEWLPYQAACLNPLVMDQFKAISAEFIRSGELGNWDFTTRLGKLNMPTLILTGDRDYAISPQNARWMARQIPNAEVTICPKGHHNLFWTDQQCYFPSLITFLGKSKK